MNSLKNLNLQINNIFNRSKQLNDDDFNKFLFNIELIKKDITQLRRRKITKLFEQVLSFRTFLNNN